MTLTVTTTPLLDSIASPADLRRLRPDQLPQVARELRQDLLGQVSRTGGHLSSNLGTVELSVALHYVYNTPQDRLVWDVGHQTYPHKMLTGRRHRMPTLRQLGGLSGFPRRDESEYDAFGTAHSSTSISAALGMAMAARIKGESRRAVAIIGDGALTGGMAFEALNHAGDTHANLLVILNDNDMSISPPVGALNKYLARLMSGGFYSAAREGAKSVLKNTPLYELARRFEEHTKGMVVPGTIFEEFGFNYVGPIDGHDLDALIPTLQNLRERSGPQFLHVITRKGKGYDRAEADPIAYHGPSKFDPTIGLQPAPASAQTFTQVFGQWLCDMAQQDERLVGITPAMREGSGMVEFARRFPQRYADVGIAEQHAVTYAAGLACEGLKPVLAIYSTFLQRGYDQLIHDVAIQNLPIVFALDRAGLVGADGATHAGNYDMAYLRCVPNMAVLTPSDENECRQLLTTAYAHPGPAAVRYPRGSGVGTPVQMGLETLPWGCAERRRTRTGSGDSSGAPAIAVLAFGPVLHPALEAAQALNASVWNMRFVKPLDAEAVRTAALEHDLIVTVEEGCVSGGAGSAVAEALSQLGLVRPILHLGLPDAFIEHGERSALMADCGLNAAGLQSAISAFARSAASSTSKTPS